MPNDVLDDEDLERFRAAAAGAAAPLVDILDRFEVIVTPPLASDGQPTLGLLCRRTHTGCDGDEPGGPTVLIPTTFAPRDDVADREPLERLFAQATQEGMTLADLVAHALDHEADAHG